MAIDVAIMLEALDSVVHNLLKVETDKLKVSSQNVVEGMNKMGVKERSLNSVQSVTKILVEGICCWGRKPHLKHWHGKWNYVMEVANSVGE